MSVELYVFPPSPRAFNVLAVANHLNLDYQLHFIDLRKGEQFAAPYAALNPNSRMPTMKDGDTVLWEGNAINQYLALKKPESGLLPKDDMARLDVTRWQFWDLAHWHPACVPFAFENVAKRLMGMTPDPSAVAKAVPAFEREAKVLDGHLRGRQFVTDDRLTLADFALGAPLSIADEAGYPLAAYGEIKRWYQTLEVLPAWQKTLQQARAPIAAAA